MAREPSGQLQNEPVNAEDPIEEKGIKINKFTIDKLRRTPDIGSMQWRAN